MRKIYKEKEKEVKRIVLFLGILLIGALIVACSPKISPMEKSAAPDALKQETEIVGKETWQAEWDRILAQAKKEGSVILYTDQGDVVRQAITEEMNKKYGIDLRITGGKGGQLAAKTLAEKNAGLHLVDMSISGPGTATLILKPAGVLAPIEPELILPEVLDSKAWFENRLPFADKERTLFTFTAYVNPMILINNNLVSREEIKSYKDLLNPKWKGKILWYDPFMETGSGAQFARVIGLYIMGLDYMRELAKQQPVLTQDRRLVVEWVARGKYPISIGATRDQTKEFTLAGAPIEEFTPVEGSYLASGGSAGNFYIYKNSPHPNARKIFINWFLSKEGQTLWSKTADIQSARVDVPIDHLDRETVRKPGVKYISTLPEEWQLTRDKDLDRVFEVMKPWMK